MDTFLSVIIPAYNEEERIERTLLEVEDFLSTRNYSSEIIVVNDGSRDNTGSIVKRVIFHSPSIALIEYEKNQGKGYAVRKGMLQAKGTYRLFMDADNSTSIEQFERMFPFFKEGYDIVIGSRAIKGAKIMVHQPRYKEMLGKLGNLFIQAVALPGLWDTQAGFKCFTQNAASQVFSLVTIDRWGFDVEALVIARHLGLRIKEVPITWINDPFTHVGSLSYMEVLREVVEVRLKLLRKEYEFKK